MNQESIYKTAFNTFKTPEKAAAALADQMVDQTKKAIDDKGQCVWAVSGGSSILKLYDALSHHADFFERIGNSLIVTLVDERVVPHTDPKSNYGSAKDYFWNKFKDVQMIPVPYASNPKKSADQFENALEQEGIGRGDIDIIILGMGSDGHTASLFPLNEKLKENDKDIVPVSDPSVDVDRVSMTFPLINSSRNLYLYFYGGEKGITIRDAIDSGDRNQYPILVADWEKLMVYTDQVL